MNKVILRVYTREVDKECYPAGLANSVHFSYKVEGEEEKPLHKNYGILFVEGVITSEDTIAPRGVKNPMLFTLKDGTYGVCAEVIWENGMTDENCSGKVFWWSTKDFVSYKKEGFMSLTEVASSNPATSIELSYEVLEKAIQYWTPIVNTGVELASEVNVTDSKQLNDIKATCVYSDGSKHEKNVLWDSSTIDFNKPGTYSIDGKVLCNHYPFPLTKGYGDPVLLHWEGKWYFIATNDNLNDIGLYVRESEDIFGLFAENVVEHLILPFDKARCFEQTFWAPEFHVIGGELYILFAVSGEMWGPQCHVMKFKRDGSIIDEHSWENPIPVKRMDGTALAPGAITLDMTYIKADNASYMVWSYRKHIGSLLDTGSMLYIATVDETKPWNLTSAPVLLTRPLYGWENVEGTINNEGPYAFIKDGKVYLTYSGGAANGYTYALGLLTSDTDADLLDLHSWEKSITPVLTFYSVDGEYGPGHNSFFVEENGDLMIAYHGETDIKEHLRCDGIRRVHFRADGTPYFGMAVYEDLKEEFKNVKCNIVVK